MDNLEGNVELSSFFSNGKFWNYRILERVFDWLKNALLA